MKKFFFLLIILFFFLSGDRLISKLLISLTNFSSLPYAKIYTDRAQSDILILGDSRAYHHLNDYDWTKYLRKKSFIDIICWVFINISEDFTK